MQQVKVGLVGLGGIGSLSLNFYRENPNVEIAAVCDVRDLRVKEVCETLKISQGFTNINEMISGCPELDLVSIHNIDAAHVSSTLAALQAGKHVFVEKPMGLTIEDCHLVSEVARQSGKKVAVGQVVRFRKYTRTLKQLISQGTLGTIYNIESEYITDQMRMIPNFSKQASTSYSPGVVTLGVHAVDTMRWLVGEIVEVMAIQNKGMSYPSCDFDEATLSIFRFENGCIGRLTTCWSSVTEPDPYMGMKIYGSKGTVIGNRLILHGMSEGMALPNPVDKVDILKQELDSVIDSILHEEPMFCDASDGGNTAIVCLSILEAATTGRVIQVRNIVG